MSQTCVHKLLLCSQNSAAEEKSSVVSTGKQSTFARRQLLVTSNLNTCSCFAPNRPWLIWASASCSVPQIPESAGVSAAQLQLRLRDCRRKMRNQRQLALFANRDFFFFPFICSTVFSSSFFSSCSSLQLSQTCHWQPIRHLAYR